MPPEIPPVEIPAAWLTVLEAFERQQVQYVVAGSAADAIVESDPASAGLLIVAPAPYRRNLERLATALGALGVRVRAANGNGESLPVEASQVVNHPAVRWRLLAGETELDVIGSAVGDGEFSIRLWRTRRIELTCDGRSVAAEVELVSPAFSHAPSA